jgi:hypothetical protein
MSINSITPNTIEAKTTPAEQQDETQKLEVINDVAVLTPTETMVEAPAQEAIPETVVEAPVQEAIPETVVEAPVQEAIPETVVETPAQEAIPETVVETPSEKPTRSNEKES